MNDKAKEIQIKDEEELEIDLLDLINYMRERWIMLAGLLLAGAVIAAVVTHFLITPLYTATTKLYMVSASHDSVVDLTDLNVGTSLSTDYVEMIKIRPIFEEVIEEEKLPYTYEQLLSMTTIETIQDTRILNITVESPKPKEAQVVANALAKKAASYLPKLMDTPAPNIAESAIYPQHKSSPSLAKNTLIGGIAGIAIAIIIIVIMYLSDDTLKTDEDVEKMFGVMPLTVIPEGDIDMSGEEKARDNKGGNE